MENSISRYLNKVDSIKENITHDILSKQKERKEGMYYVCNGYEYIY